MKPQDVIDFLINWTPVVIIGASLLNAFTSHWTEKPKWFKGFFAVVERLSFLASKNVEKKPKMIFTDRRPGNCGNLSGRKWKRRGL